MKQTIIDKKLIPTETDFLNTVVMPLINDVCNGGYADPVHEVVKIAKFYEVVSGLFYGSFYDADTYLLVLCKSDKSIHIRHDDWEIVKRETINQ